MSSLLDQMEKEEKESIRIPRKKEKSAVKAITENDGAKDKQISAKVNAKSWDTFTRINKAQGLSNNSALNMIINKYVRENRGIIEE